MSFNGLVEQAYLLKLATLGVVLDKYKPKWASAPTAEEQFVAQADAIQTFYRLLKAEDPDLVSEFQHLDLANLESFYSMYELQQKTNSAGIQTLMNTFITRFNNYQLTFTDLTSQIRRIKQKKAVLGLYSGERAKYVVTEQFVNTEKLASNFTSDEALEVNTDQGLLTLPVLRKQPVSIDSIRIGSGSNGQAGNSDKQVQTDNQSVNVLISNSDDVFEYERLDQGPCKLVLVLDLLKPQVVNQLTIVPVDVGVPLGFDVTDVVFTSSGKQSLSIYKLLVANSDTFSVEPTALTNGWQCSFLPVETISVAITLEQTASYQIRTASTDKRTVVRDRFPIALKSIQLNRIEYKESGGINSVELPLRKNLYAVEPEVHITPEDTKFFDYVLEVSFDNGLTWKQAGTDDETNVTLVTNNDGGFLWRLSLKRTSAAFNAFSEFLPSATKTSVNTVLKSVSRFVSPTVVNLTGPAKNDIHVIQPRIGRRGNKSKAFRLGSTTNGVNKLRVPFNLLARGIKPSEAKLYVGGTQYYRKNPGETITGIEWAFADSHEEVIVSDLAAGTPVDLVLDSEQMLLTEQTDGYHHKCKLDFDPDKDNIVVSYLAREPSRKSVVLPRGDSVISLGVNSILSDSLSLVSNNGVTYTEVDTRDEVYDNTDHEYFVDYENGVLYLATAIANDTVRASFDYQPKRVLDSTEFDVVYTNGLPTHVRINKSALEAITVTEQISAQRSSVINVLTGVYAPLVEIVPTGATRKKQLSNDYIIVNTFQAPVDLLENGLIPEEVDYIDGHTEFLGLTEVTIEQTNETTAAGSVVSFALGARSLWYKNFGVVFSNTAVFANQLNSSAAVTSGSTGDYFITDDGTVYVNVGPGGTLTGGIKLSYYFKNPSFRPNNKFSIDYEAGILYTHTRLNQSAIVTYKTASYCLDYDIAKQIPSQYLVDSHSVEIKTENLDPINNQVKVLWEQDTSSQVDAGIQQYFSPLVSSLAFRFR